MLTNLARLGLVCYFSRPFQVNQSFAFFLLLAVAQPMEVSAQKRRGCSEQPGFCLVVLTRERLSGCIQCPAQSFLERDGRLVAEVLARPGNVRQRMAHVAGPSRAEDRL